MLSASEGWERYMDQLDARVKGTVELPVQQLYERRLGDHQEAGLGPREREVVQLGDRRALAHGLLPTGGRSRGGGSGPDYALICRDAVERSGPAGPEYYGRLLEGAGVARAQPGSEM